MVDNEGIDLEEDGEGGGFDFERLAELWSFVKNAARRRFKLALAVFVVVATLGIGVAAVMPRKYSAELKLSQQRTSVTRSIVNGQQGGAPEEDTTTKSVAQMIMRRENLVALVRDAHLVDRFQETRPLPLKLKDKLMAKIFGAPSREDMEKAMVGTLETQLTVGVTDDGLVDIVVDWANPQIAYDIATLVQTNFLAARYDDDINAINESIAILDDHAKNELAIVDAALANYQKVVDERIVAPLAAAAASSAGRPSGAAPARVYYQRTGGVAAPVALAVDPEVTKALEDKRAQIKALEDSQQRGLDALRQQLATATLTLTPMHPTVITLQQRIDALSQPSPELAKLQADEHALMAQIAGPHMAPSAAPAPGPRSAVALGAPAGAAAADAGAPDTAALPPPIMAGNAPDGQVQLAQSKLEAAIRSYQDAIGRGDGARVQLDLAHATFQHRYQVFTPAEVPKKPKKATATIVGVASALASVLLALLAAAAADLGTGVVIEPWQVRRRLKLDIIGELDNPS
jgi:uncharacterized protein involved in exopolysaccharide biosynthesis